MSAAISDFAEVVLFVYALSSSFVLSYSFSRAPLEVRRAKSEGKNPVYYVPGQTASGRHLFCVVIRCPDGNGYPVPTRYSAVFACNEPAAIDDLRWQFFLPCHTGQRGRMWRIEGAAAFRADMNVFKDCCGDNTAAAHAYWSQPETTRPLIEYHLIPPVTVLEEVELPAIWQRCGRDSLANHEKTP